MIRSILTVGGWTMASRLLGFLRDILVAALIGTGPVADAFFVALRLPNLFRRLFGEGAFSAAFVPAFTAALADGHGIDGQGAARRLAEQVASVLLFWLAGLSLCGVVLMPQIMLLLAPGFAAMPAKFALAVALSRITFPYLMFICLTALLSGVLNGLDRFAAAAATPIVFNVCLIAALLLLRPFVPSAGHALAYGVTISGMAQLALLGWACARAGMALRLPWPRLTPAVRLVLRRMGPGILGAGVTQINLMVDVVIASLLPAGTVSVLYYADRVNQLPLGTIGAAVGTAMLPLLSRQVRAGAAREAIETLNRATEYALTLTLPAALALAVAGGPIMAVLFGRGAFGADAAARSGQALAAYARGLPAFVLAKVFAPGFFARGDTATPVRVGLVSVALNLALNLALMRPLSYLAPALATSLAALFNAACLAVLLARRGHFRLDRRLRRRLGRMALAAGAMAGTLLLALHAGLDPSRAGHGLRWLALVALIGLGLLSYAIAGHALGGFDLRELRRLLRRRGDPAAMLPPT
jgi:putative peptidoglycan lipid II flippase